jgi:hypothetical protein
MLLSGTFPLGTRDLAGLNLKPRLDWRGSCFVRMHRSVRGSSANVSGEAYDVRCLARGLTTMAGRVGVPPAFHRTGKIEVLRPYCGSTPIFSS